MTKLRSHTLFGTVAETCSRMAEEVAFCVPQDCVKHEGMMFC